jgi:hypothetical protein
LRQKNDNRRKGLDEIKTSWDKNLVDQLIKETPFNQADIKEIMRDTHGIINHKKITQRYELLREYSDILGLPVWAVMTKDSSQEVMKGINEEIDKNIAPYRVSDLGEILTYISEQANGVTALDDGDKKHVEIIVSTLRNILHRYERWSKEWRLIFSTSRDHIKKDNNHNWICNLLFMYNTEIIYRGTLRFYKKSLTHWTTKPPYIKDSFTTTWFFVKKMIPSAKKPRLILSIIDDISTEIFSCEQPHISLNTENDDEMLLSWNSNFEKKVVLLPDLASNFHDQMRDLNSISMYATFNINEQYYHNEIDVTKSFDENESSRKQIFDGTTRNFNTLEYLLRNGFIKDGDQIVFKNGEDPSFFEYAEILIPYRKPMLLWNGDIHHFSTLTKELLSKQHMEIDPNYCAKYWYLPGRQYSLYELVNYIKMISKL